MRFFVIVIVCKCVCKRDNREEGKKGKEEEKRVRINVTMTPTTLKATDSVAKMCNVSRSAVVEAGLMRVFAQFLELFSESLNEVQVNG